MRYKKVKEDLFSIYNSFLKYCVTRVSTIKRYNTRRIVFPQSVMEHIGSTALIAMVISDYFNSIGIKNNAEKVLRLAIVHDLDEVISGDIPHDAKYQMGSVSDVLRTSLDTLASATFNDMVSKIEAFKDVYFGVVKPYAEYKSRRSIESKIVKLADFLDVYLYSENEMAVGNTYIVPEYKNSYNRFIKLLKSVVEYEGSMDYRESE